MKNYTPRPANTDDIVLSHDMLELAVTLARDAHERWAQLQMKNGWHWGIRRNPMLHRDPDLTYFDQLPVLTREHIIHAAEQNIKTILACGYHITPPPKAA